MGECIFINHSGKPRKLPILNENYPANASVEYKGGATFKVEIAVPGYPEEYTYQWYKNGSAISGATGSSYSVSNQTESATFYCTVTNKKGTVQSRTATLTVATATPDFTCSGDHQFIDEGNGNWNLIFRKTGKLKFTNRGTGVNGIEVFLVGGGGGGANAYWASGGGGGGGGYTTTASVNVLLGEEYDIVVANGGEIGGVGGTSTAFGFTANGGNPGSSSKGGSGGSGGGSGGHCLKQSGFTYRYHPGAGGTNGGSGGKCSDNCTNGGSGQGPSTYAFGDSNYKYDGVSPYPFAGGGGGGRGVEVYTPGSETDTAAGGNYGGGGSGKSGTSNTGGGGGGGDLTFGSSANPNYGTAGKGGSGIVIIRNKR